MTRRLIATAILAVTVGGPIFAAVPAHASTGNQPLACVGGDTSNRGQRWICVDDPTRG